MFLGTALRTLGEVGFNLTVGAFRDRTRTRQFNSTILTFRQHYAVEACLPPADLALIFPAIDRVSVTLERFRPRFANVSLAELVCLASISAWLQPSKVLEIGTFDGNTTLQLALNSPSHCRIHTLALPPGSDPPAGALSAREMQTFDEVPVGERFRDHPLSAKIVQHLGDSAQFDFSAFEGKVDLIFVDGSHQYDYVAADTQSALGCCSPRGVILWHDFCAHWPGVVRAVRELPAALQVRQIPGTTLALCCPGRSLAR